MALSQRVYDLTHGWHGLIFAYGLIAAASLGGLIVGQATLRKYFFWPFTSLVTLVIVGLLGQFLFWAFGAVTGNEAGPVGQMIFSVIFFLLGGFWGGLVGRPTRRRRRRLGTPAGPSWSMAPGRNGWPARPRRKARTRGH